MVKAVQLVMSHLVFDVEQTGIDYFQLYKYGLLSGRLVNSSCFGVSKSNVKPLHPSLKQVFLLDNCILSELLKDFDLPYINMDESLSSQLTRWITGLESLHRHFLPLSKSIFKFEAKIKVGLRLEEVLVLVRDYISLTKMAQTNSIREDDVSKIHSTFNSIGDINSSRIMGSMLQLNNAFSNWVQVLLDD
jgi:hypothetical protein